MNNMQFLMIGNGSDPTTWEWVPYILSQYPVLEAKGVASYSFVANNGTSPIPIGIPTISGFYGTAVIPNTTDPGLVLAAYAPIVEHIHATWPGKMTFIQQTTVFPSFLDWFRVYDDSGSPAGKSLYMPSRLMDEASFTRDLATLGTTVRDLAAATGGTFVAFMLGGSGVWDARPRGGSNAVLPGWRKVVAHISRCYSFMVLMLGQALLAGPYSWVTPFSTPADLVTTQQIASSSILSTRRQKRQPFQKQQRQSAS